jgi:hypothetical protein
LFIFTVQFKYIIKNIKMTTNTFKMFFILLNCISVKIKKIFLF